MGKAIVITSGKGGTGKTSTTAALSARTAVLGYKTLCVDADINLRNLDLCLGLAELSTQDFRDVLLEYCSLGDAVLAHPRVNMLDFLPSPASATVEDIDPQTMYSLIVNAKKLYDFIFIDSPAGLDAGFRIATQGADMAIIVATHDNASYRDAARAVLKLGELDITDVRLIVNRVRPRLLNRLGTNIDDAIDSIGAQLIGLVPEDKNVIVASNSGMPLHLISDKGASMAYDRIAKRICGTNVKLSIPHSPLTF